MKTIFSRIRLLAIPLALFACGSLLADKVTLKDGTVYEGKITKDEGEFLVIEVVLKSDPKPPIFLPEEAEGSTIRDVKRIKKGDVEKVEKPDEDDLKFAEIQQLLPTKSLVSAADYRTLLLEPTRFLTSFPDSEHAEAVAKIKEELEDELAKVEGGFLKIQGEWITKDERNIHRANTDARIAYFNMLRQAQSGDSGLVRALRTFDQIEKQYGGSTVYADAIVTAQTILPLYGQQLAGQIRSFAYRDAQRKKGEATLSGEELIRYQRTKAQQEAAFKNAREAAKDRGDRWLPVNQNDLKSLEEGVKVVQSEIERLAELDREAIQARAKGLYEVEEMLQSEDLETLKAAQAKFKALLQIKVGKGSSSKDPYFVGIQEKLDRAIDRAEALAVLAAREPDPAAAGETSGTEESATTEGGETEAGDDGGAEEPVSALAALESTRPTVANAPKAEKKKTTRKKSGSRTPPNANRKAKDYSDWEAPTSPFTKIMIGVAAVLIIVTGVMYMKNKGAGGGG